MPRSRFDNAWDGELFGEYDNDEVFKYAETAQLVTGAIHPEPDPKWGWTFADIRRPLYWDEGENDGASWIAVVQLKDGDYGAVSAGCDYTGWGCQEGGSACRSKELDLIIRWWLGEDDRERLGITL